MVLLSNREVDTIHDLLLTRGVSHDSLRMDLLDHLCCMVEERMDLGAPFEVALSESTDGFGPQGFEKTQEETLYLLTSKLRTMKKITSIFGIVGSALTLMGILFKIMHWPMAGILLVLGIVLIAFLFMPLVLSVRLKESSTTMARFVNITGVSAALVFLVSVLFKIMHWPYANVLMTGSLFAVAFIFIPGYFIRSYRTAENKLMSVAYTLVMFTAVFLLYRMTANGSSKDMQNSIYVMHESTRSEIKHVNEEREELVIALAPSMSPEMKALNASTEALLSYIENMRVLSISVTQEVSKQEAATLNLKDASWGLNAHKLKELMMDAESECNAKQLRALIEEWKENANEAGVSSQRLESWFALKTIETPQYGSLTWEEAHFEHATIFSVVTYLEQLTLEINQRFIQVAVSQKASLTQAAAPATS